jgi:Peptidase MA superfamily
MRLVAIPTFLMFLTIISPVKSSSTQDVTSLETKVTHIFSESIYFSADIKSDGPIVAAVLFFQAEGDPRTNVGLAQVRSLGENSYQATYLHRISDYAIRPFATISFHWELTMSDGEVYTSPDEYFLYDDNRFAWQTMEQDNFLVHWYQGDLQFAQDMIAIAKRGNNEIQSILPMPEPGNIAIYIYPDSESMQAVLQTGTESWIAGHADPDLSVILVALPDTPEQRLLAEQRIPHELVHILLYRYTRVGYTHLPTWLKEGLASAGELYPNPDYRILLENASTSNNLLPLRDLCDTFPSEASSALLAYAESQSFIQYLHSTFGTPGLQALVTAYANGLDCESGAHQALGKSLDQIENNWQHDVLNQNVAFEALRNLSPWILLLLAVLVAPLMVLVIRIRSPQIEV